MYYVDTANSPILLSQFEEPVTTVLFMDAAISSGVMHVWGCNETDLGA